MLKFKHSLHHSFSVLLGLSEPLDSFFSGYPINSQCISEGNIYSELQQCFSLLALSSRQCGVNKFSQYTSNKKKL